MKLGFLIWSIIIVHTTFLFSQETKYKVSDIPKNLLANSKVVIRNENIEFEIFSPKEAVQRVEYAITILNDNGIDDSKLIQFYDKFSSIRQIKARIYDKDGKLVKKNISFDILDYSAISGYSIYEDNRVKYIDPKYRNVPFTIEFSYEVIYSGLLSYPQWMPYKDFNISVEKSNFKVLVPTDLALRYLEKNIIVPCNKTNELKKTSYSWQLTNGQAITNEDYSLPLQDYLPMVYIAPKEFEIDNYAGNFESWRNFGKWISKLNEGKDILSEETKIKIRNLVSGTSDDIEKIKILYEYLQNKTRYVSIQVGIGGWQPFEASTVDKFSYGDCKALTNYMYSILKVAGIKSYYSLILAGREKATMISEFPFNQFNHAILCVPTKNDTIWLECTSQITPCGYLGTFTDDRDALLITDSGGVLVHTPVYKKDDNIMQTKAFVTIEKSNSNAQISLKSKGMFYDQMLGLLHSDEVDKKRIIENMFNVPDFEIISYNTSEEKSRLPAINLDLSILIKNHTTVIGDRLLVPLNILHKIKDIPRSCVNRKSDISITRSFQTIDSIIYNIPNGYLLEEIPQNKEIETQYGLYRMILNKKENQLIYVRKFILNKGIFPKEEYENFIVFFENIEKLDNSIFILKLK